MNLCLNAFVIQFPDDVFDTCLVSVPRALLLRFAHRGHCKDEDSYKECSSHVKFSISLTRIRLHLANYFLPFRGGKRLKGCTARIVPNYSRFRKRNRFRRVAQEVDRTLWTTRE